MINAPRAAGHFHAVRFYESDESLCRIVGQFLGEGLVDRQPVLVMATPGHRAGIADELRARKFDPDAMAAAGDLVMLDAAEALETFMVDGMPDAERFLATATRIIETIVGRRRGCTIRAYGEMVDVLWKDGHDVAAIRLEMLWNKLAAKQDFSLLCGYAMGNFYKDVGLQAIHHQHSHVLIGDGAITQARQARGI